MIINVLSFNIHKGKGWHRLIPTFKDIDEHIRVLSPDLIFFQEILGAQAEKIVLDLWQQYSYGKNVTYPRGHFGNATFSRFPILYSENFDLSTSRFERRGLLHSIVELPSQQRLHLLCVHLGLFKTGRLKQFKQIADYIKSIIQDDEPIILGGDFNDWSSAATVPLVDDLGLREAFLSCHGAYARTYPAWSPFLKLDRLYTRGMKVLDAERMLQKSWCKLSDHLAIKATFEIEG